MTLHDPATAAIAAASGVTFSSVASAFDGFHHPRERKTLSPGGCGLPQ
ncbi:MAG: hypothetical protein ACK4PN_15790 [Allorhizobium sp.]